MRWSPENVMATMGIAVILVMFIGLPASWIYRLWMDWRTIREVRRERERRTQ